jgi:hypothetical protein
MSVPHPTTPSRHHTPRGREPLRGRESRRSGARTHPTAPPARRASPSTAIIGGTRASRKPPRRPMLQPARQVAAWAYILPGHGVTETDGDREPRFRIGLPARMCRGIPWSFAWSGARDRRRSARRWPGGPPLAPDRAADGLAPGDDRDARPAEVRTFDDSEYRFTRAGGRQPETDQEAVHDLVGATRSRCRRGRR